VCGTLGLQKSLSYNWKFVPFVQHLSIFFSSHVLVATFLLFPSMSSTIFNSTDKWNHIALTFSVRLISFNIVSTVHLCCIKWQDFLLLWVNNIPLGVCIIFSLSIYLSTERLLPYLNYCEYCCNEHGYAVKLFNMLISFSLDI
jgi:hypothetical protein